MTTKRNRIYVTAHTNALNPTSIRIALNPEAAIEINDRDWATGIRMDRCWFGRNRIVIQAYSIWDDGTGRCVGTRYSVISDPAEILQFCEKADIYPPEWVEAEEI